MCGIVGYIGNLSSKKMSTMKLKYLVDLAYLNVHRGDDGIGLIYKNGSSLSIEKYELNLEELKNKLLKGDRVLTTDRVGSIEVVVEDQKKYEDIQREFKSKMNKLLNVSSTLAFIHHRKASFGSNSIENLHPFEYNGKYYMHNGTAYGIESVKKWLEINSSIKFNSETDTEVLAVLYNLLTEKLKNPKLVYNALIEMFYCGFGVLIEITKDGKVTVIKDEARDLWMYITKQNGIILISEPSPCIPTFNALYLLKSGIFEIDSNTKGKDFSTWAIAALKWWNDPSNSQHISEKKCDICGVDKQSLSTFHVEPKIFGSVREDRCFECLVNRRYKREDEVAQDEDIREISKNVIGDL